MNTSIVEPKRLSANQRLLRSLEDTAQRNAMPAVFDALEPLDGTWLLRRIGASVPKPGVERENYVTAARIAVVVALLSEDMQARPLDDETRDVLFRRAGEVFKTVYGSAHATAQTRLTSGHARSRTTAPPVETTLTNEEIAAVLIAPHVLRPAEHEALMRIWNNTPYPPTGTREYERERKVRHRARLRLINIKESGHMPALIAQLNDLRDRLEAAERIGARLDVIERFLGLDVAAQADEILAAARPLGDVEDDVRDLMQGR